MSRPVARSMPSLVSTITPIMGNGPLQDFCLAFDLTEADSLAAVTAECTVLYAIESSLGYKQKT